MDAKQLRDGDFFDTTGKLFKGIQPSFEALKLNIWTFLALIFIPLIIFIVAFPLAFLPLLTGSDSSAAVAVAFAFLVGLAVLVAALIFAPAIVQTQIASVKGQKVEFQEAFNKGMPFVLRFIGLGLLSALVVIVGLILFIIPGLLAIFFLSFAPYILIDKNTGVIDAMKGSYELVKEYWKVTLGLLVVNLVINIPSNLLPFFGGLITLALSIGYFCLGALVYVNIAGKATATKEAVVVKKTASPKAK